MHRSPSVFHPISPTGTSIMRVHSLRVRWVLCAPPPFVLHTSRGEGPSPCGSLPVWTALPSSDYSAPSDSPCGPWRFVGVSLPYLPTRLDIPHEVSRVPHRRLKRNDEGGVFLLAPSALCGFSVSLQGRAGFPGVPLPGLIWLWPLLWPRSNHFGHD